MAGHQILITLETPLREGQEVHPGHLVLIGSSQARFSVSAAVCKSRCRLVCDLLEDAEGCDAQVPVPLHSSLENMTLLATWLRHEELLGDDLPRVRLPLPVGATRLEDVVLDDWDRAFVRECVCGVEQDRHLVNPAALLNLLQLANFLGASALENLLVAYVAFYLRWAAREEPDVAAAASAMFGRSAGVTAAELADAEEWVKQQCMDVSLRQTSYS